jgi:hypothetical protein
METVYSGLLTFASLSDGIAEGDGCFFFGLGLIIGADILELFEFFEQTLVELDGKNGRYFVSLLVSDECGGHTRQIYGLVGIGLTGFGIPQKSINDIEQDRLGISIQGFNIFQPFNGLFIVSGMFAFSQ